VFDEGFVTDYPLTIRHRDDKLTDVLYVDPLEPTPALAEGVPG